jgi:hypothetical protein
MNVKSSAALACRLLRIISKMKELFGKSSGCTACSFGDLRVLDSDPPLALRGNIEGRPFGHDPEFWAALARALIVDWAINTFTLSIPLIQMTVAKGQ